MVHRQILDHGTDRSHINTAQVPELVQVQALGMV